MGSRAVMTRIVAQAASSTHHPFDVGIGVSRHSTATGRPHSLRLLRSNRACGRRGAPDRIRRAGSGADGRDTEGLRKASGPPEDSPIATIDTAVRRVELREPVKLTSSGPRLDGRPGSSKKLVLLCEHFYPEMISTGMHMTKLATRLAELGWRPRSIRRSRPGGRTATRSGPFPWRWYEGVRSWGSDHRKAKGETAVENGLLLTFVLSVSWALVRRRATTAAW